MKRKSKNIIIILIIVLVTGICVKVRIENLDYSKSNEDEKTYSINQLVDKFIQLKKDIDLRKETEKQKLEVQTKKQVLSEEINKKKIEKENQKLEEQQNSNTDNSDNVGTNNINNNSNTNSNNVIDNNTNKQNLIQSYDQSTARQVLNLVNQVRAENGLQQLTWNSSLEESAKIRSEELIANFSHTRPDGTLYFTAVTTNYSLVGENVAAGQVTAQEVFNAWMNSEGHRANILNPEFNQMAVALYKDPTDEYEYYWVQLFITQ